MGILYILYIISPHLLCEIVIQGLTPLHFHIFIPDKMVKLTIDLIARGTSGYTKKKRDETMNQYLKRLTHLYLENKGIDEVVFTSYINSKN